VHGTIINATIRSLKSANRKQEAQQMLR